MAPEEIEERFAALGRELMLLKCEMLKTAGVDVIPGFGPVGAFRDDPTFDEAVRLGREHRDRENQESLAGPDCRHRPGERRDPDHPKSVRFQ